MSAVPPPVGPDIKLWANQVVLYLKRTASFLGYKDSTMTPSTNGALVWDEVNGHPVVSKNGVWRQIVLADGYAIFGQDVDITAAAIDTAYKVPLDNFMSQGITLTGSPLTDITFSEGGLYSLSFAAQISSASASQVDFRFWPRINAANVPGSTIVASLHNNGATFVVSRTAIFNVSAGDVLNVMWAVSNTSGRLKAHAATAYAPVAPSVTLNIVRVQG